MSVVLKCDSDIQLTAARTTRNLLASSLLNSSIPEPT